MFRFFSRVVVVSVVALSLNFAVVPAAEARVQTSNRQVSTAVDQGCVEKAMNWLNQVLGKEPKGVKKNRKKMTGNDGCTIDPFGNPKCP